MKEKVVNRITISKLEDSKESSDLLKTISKYQREESKSGFNIKDEYSTRIIEQNDSKIVYEIYTSKRSIKPDLVKSISKGFPRLSFKMYCESKFAGNEQFTDYYVIEYGEIKKEDHTHRESDLEAKDKVFREAMLAKLKDSKSPGKE